MYNKCKRNAGPCEGSSCPAEDPCHGGVDAVTKYHGEVWLFRGAHYWRLSEEVRHT